MAANTRPASAQSSSSSRPASRRGSSNAAAAGQSSSSSSHLLAAKETFSTLKDLSRLLNTGLDDECLALCVRLCENGANPEALATVIKEIRKQSEAIKQQEES